jgi:hypothetical protein
MPLYEVETDAHIIITWAADDRSGHSADETAPRYVGHFQGSIRSGRYPGRSLRHCPRLLAQIVRGQSARHSLVYARNGDRFGTRPESD